MISVIRRIQEEFKNTVKKEKQNWVMQKKMLALMCPNCRHRFSVPGCCNPNSQGEETTLQIGDYGNYYNSGHLFPQRFNTAGGCFINAPTIINGSTIIQSNGENITNKIESCRGSFREQIGSFKPLKSSPACHINTTCDLTGGTVTITTPSIQSGGCLIQTTDSGFLVQAPRIEIRPKLSGGGCLVQKKFPADESITGGNIFDDVSYFDGSQTDDKMEDLFTMSTPSGCQELPGTRYNSNFRSHLSCPPSPHKETKRTSCPNLGCPNGNRKRCPTDCCYSSKTNCCHGNGESRDNTVQIQVNATVQLPPNVSQCTVNINATTTDSRIPTNIGAGDSSGIARTSLRNRNNFHGGGLVQMEESTVPNSCENEPRREETPTTPVFWLMPCPWGYETMVQNKDLTKLADIKRRLHMSGWYHEGLSWQQSESLLKNSPVGRWLMRDSSHSSYTFAISAQTPRGPTSIRVLFLFGKFRLDAKQTMPVFDCPIKMLEYYVEYSNRNDDAAHVWIDFSGQIYSRIYLTQPYVKEVGSLSHLARLAVNKHQLPVHHLPIPIRNYIDEYPYKF